MGPQVPCLFSGTKWKNLYIKTRILEIMVLHFLITPECTPEHSGKFKIMIRVDWLFILGYIDLILLLTRGVGCKVTTFCLLLIFPCWVIIRFSWFLRNLLSKRPREKLHLIGKEIATAQLILNSSWEWLYNDLDPTSTHETLCCCCCCAAGLVTTYLANFPLINEQSRKWMMGPNKDRCL